MKNMPFEGFKIEVKGENVYFHSFAGSKIVSKRTWYKPWHKLWRVEVELFDLFSLPTTFSDGLIRVYSPLYSTQEEAKEKQKRIIQVIKSVTG